MRVVWLTALCALAFSVDVSTFADSTKDTMNISSPAFAVGKPMPAKFAYKGPNISPPLHISSVPANAKSLALVVDDPDAPMGLWTHWLVWNLPATTSDIAEGAVPSGALQGMNSFGNAHYGGPAPPSGTHRYFFHLYALDTMLSLSSGSTRDALLAVMKGHVVGTGETFGTYSASP